MNILTMVGGFSVMSDQEVIQFKSKVLLCVMCSDQAAKVYHEIENPQLHASGQYLVGLMPKLHKVEVI